MRQLGLGGIVALTVVFYFLGDGPEWDHCTLLFSVDFHCDVEEKTRASMVFGCF